LIHPRSFCSFVILALSDRSGELALKLVEVEPDILLGDEAVAQLENV